MDIHDIREAMKTEALDRGSTGFIAITIINILFLSLLLLLLIYIYIYAFIRFWVNRLSPGLGS